MEALNLLEITQAVGGQLYNSDADAIVTSIMTQAANIRKGTLFIPYTGSKAVPEELVKSAYEKGAAAAVLPHTVHCPIPQIIVTNTITALTDLCRFYRCRFDIPVIGITGSAGKTSTKDMLASVLSQKLSICKTMGNKNDLSGIIETTLGIQAGTDAAIIELGFSGYFGINEQADYKGYDVKETENGIEFKLMHNHELYKITVPYWAGSTLTMP